MAKPAVRLTGIKTVMKNLNKEVKLIEGRSAAGLFRAAILVRRDMEKTEPKIPIDTGNLRASWFTTMTRTPLGPSMTLGFSANYAVFVHENMEANFKRPGSGPKFFEKALQRNHSKILAILKNNTQIK